MTYAVFPINGRFGENITACCIPSMVYATLNLAVYAPSFCTPIVKLQRGTEVEVDKSTGGAVPTVSHLDPVNPLLQLKLKFGVN